jgi:hypothetical protein
MLREVADQSAITCTGPGRIVLASPRLVEAVVSSG